jgi:hypothetical protein
MSDGVIAPDTSPNVVPLSRAALHRPEGLFTAFHEERHSRWRWVLAALVPVTLALVGWFISYQSARTFQIVTPRGFMTVTNGMSPQEVAGLLGRPLTREQSGSSECYRFGQPTLVQEAFVVYSVCYEDGKLQSVTQRKFSAWTVDPSTGAFVPPTDGKDTPVESSAGGPP